MRIRWIRAVCLLAFLSTGALAADRIAGVPSDQITPIRLDRFVGMKQWEFTIAETNLSRVDLRLLLGEEELLHTWHVNIGTNQVNRLDVAIDFLDDLNINKWRFYSAIEGGAGWFNRQILVPEWAAARNLRKGSMSSTPGPRGNNRFQLLRMNYDDGQMKKSVPLYLQIVLNGEPLPPNTTSTAWPPVADPALTAPPAALTPELVAEAFGFAGELKMSEAADWRNSSYPGIPLWSLLFSNETNTFAGAHIVGFQQGTFLTPEIEANLAEAAATYRESMAKVLQDEQHAIDGIADPAIRSSRQRVLDDLNAKVAQDAPIGILDASWGCKAYVQVMGFGPGGAVYGFITTSPAGGFDLMISTFASGEGAPMPADSEQTHEYYVNMRERPLDLLTAAGQRIAEEIFGPAEDPTGGLPHTGGPSRTPPVGHR